MKHIYFFSSLLACGIILVVLTSFVIKGVPKDLNISRESVTEYQQEEKESLADFCTEGGLIKNYDFDFELRKVTTDSYDSNDEITSRNDGFMVYTATDTVVGTPDLPYIKKGISVLERELGYGYLYTTFGKIDKACGNFSYEGGVSEDQIQKDFGMNHFNQNYLISRPAVRIIKAMYPGKEITSAEYIASSLNIFENNHTYVGSISHYIIDKNDIILMEVGTMHRNTLITHLAVINGTGQEIRGQADAIQGLKDAARESIKFK